MVTDLEVLFHLELNFVNLIGLRDAEKISKSHLFAFVSIYREDSSIRTQSD